MWYDACKVFVNIEEIIKVTKSMLEEGILYDYEVTDCINQGIIETLIHELRHLAQANPYLPEELLKQKGDDEEDAEQYARTFYAENLMNIVIKKEMELEIELD